MTYTNLEQLVGQFLDPQEIGAKPAGDWSRWTQSRRRGAITWAEKLAARYLPDEEKSGLIVDSASITPTVVTAPSGVNLAKSTVPFASFGPRLYKVRRIAATVDSRQKEFNLLENFDERMLANLNRSYSYWWAWRNGLLTLWHPIAAASTPIVITSLQYPPSHSDLYLIYTQVTPANVFDTVGETVTGVTSTAQGVVTEYGSLTTTSHWIRYTSSSGTFLSTEAIAGSAGNSGNVTHASSSFGVDSCPFFGNEENIAKGAAGYLLSQAGVRKAGVLLPEFYAWLKITEAQAQDGR